MQEVVMNDGPEHENKEKPEDQLSYEIGYGKPPKTGRFKPGQSGNPKGRKKGSRSAATIYRGLIEEKITITEGDREKKMSRLEVVLRQTMGKALKGDAKATAQLLATGRELGLIAPERIDPDAEAQNKLYAEDQEIMRRFFPQTRFEGEA
jgi:hypothetical protein